MSSSNSPKDTVLLLSVGKTNSSQKKYPNLKRYIIRWFRGLKTLTIQKKIIYFLTIMICFFLLYPTYYNRVYHKNKENKNLDLEDSSEINQSYDRLHDPILQGIMKRNAHVDQMKKMKHKNG